MVTYYFRELKTNGGGSFRDESKQHGVDIVLLKEGQAELKAGQIAGFDALNVRFNDLVNVLLAQGGHHDTSIRYSQTSTH